MLDFVRKHAKSWLVKVALGLIILVFVFWGGYTYQSRHETEVAQVGEQYISVAQYQNAYNQMVETYRRQLGSSFSEELIRKLELRKQTLERLINQNVVLQGADALGLTATTEEVRKQILDYPVFQREGRFEKRNYEAVLRQMNMSPEAFEQQVSQEITFRKTEAFIKNRAVVTDEEVLADYHFNRDQVRLAYVLVDPKPFEEQVAVDDAALQAFYQGNTGRYMEPEKREVAYVLISAEELAKDVPVKDEEVKRYYEDHESQYKREKEVHARHILIRLKPDAPQNELDKARSDAQKVLDEARKGGDFAALARKHSQDEGSAKEGGDLGFFNSKMMVPEFTEAAFALKPGQISELVKTQFGFHIIKVEEVREAGTTSFEEVKDTIAKNLKMQAAQDIAFKKARELRDLAYARKDLAKAAEEMKLALTDTVLIEARAENQSGPFPAQFRSKLFELYSGDISDPFELPSGFEVAQIKSVKAPHAIPFDQARDKVDKDYRAEQAKELALKKASEVLALAREKNSLADAAKQQNMNVRQSEIFSRQDPDKDLKLLRGESLNKVFDLKEGRSLLDAPLELGNRYVVCQLLESKPAGQPPAEDISTISKRLLQQKQMNLWQVWVTDLRKNIKVEIFKEV
ncbi:MAG: SurA N-terminal domain-containing protein [Syntrophobacter sp.]